MRVDIKCIAHVFSNSDKLTWEILIRHIIEEDCEHTVTGDACLEGGGTFCDAFKYWYLLECPEKLRWVHR